ncbi:hypothetical protein Hamer_G017062 [Homarus americanus]|uniref:Uncharacterized protein n=1 Tax=Homarus americanus TaxID=6706 RepID=A0A8J5JYW0_HOMAM|nr:hypothetical protein Hamer_G017062 [Homarus americanus]
MVVVMVVVVVLLLLLLVVVVLLLMVVMMVLVVVESPQIRLHGGWSQSKKRTEVKRSAVGGQKSRWMRANESQLEVKSVGVEI